MREGLEDRGLARGLVTDDDDLREVHDLAHAEGAQAVDGVKEGLGFRVELVESGGVEVDDLRVRLSHCGNWGLGIAVKIG